MPQRAKSNDKDLVNELVARQDDVISQLDKLEAEILGAIESISADRAEQEAETAGADESSTIKMPEPAADNEADQSSRAA